MFHRLSSLCSFHVAFYPLVITLLSTLTSVDAGRYSVDHTWSPYRNHKYRNSSAGVFVGERGVPVIVDPEEPLGIDDYTYYWDKASYVPSTNRPIVCEIKFNKKFNEFQDIYLANLTRPEIAIFDCKQSYHCCNAMCCPDYTLAMIIFLVLLLCVIILFIHSKLWLFRCCYTHLFNFNKNRRNKKETEQTQVLTEKQEQPSEVSVEMAENVDVRHPHF